MIKNLISIALISFLSLSSLNVNAGKAGIFNDTDSGMLLGLVIICGCVDFGGTHVPPHGSELCGGNCDSNDPEREIIVDRGTYVYINGKKIETAENCVAPKGTFKIHLIIKDERLICVYEK